MNELDEKLARRIAREISDGGTEAGLLPELDEISRRKALEKILAAASSRDGDFEETVQTKQNYGSFKLRAIGAFAAAAAIAGLIAIGVNLVKEARPKQEKTVTIEPAPAILGTIERVSGSVELAGIEVKESASLFSGGLIKTSGGPASASLDVGVRVLFQDGSVARVDKVDDGARVVLDTGSVWLAVDPLPGKRNISVQTRNGEVIVKGTVFNVCAETQGTEVRVLRGEVDLIPLSGQATRLKAGRTAKLGDRGSSEIAAERTKEDRDLLVSLSLVQPLDIPISEAPQTGQPEATTNEEPARVSSRSTESSKETSLDVLLSEIREKRASGDWMRVSKLYEILLREHPDNEAAKAALVSLGQLSLDKFGDPGSAIRRFNEYLATGSQTLKPEALQGKADALHALGDLCGESRLLSEYVAQFPTAVFAVQARQRIERIDRSDLEGKACPDSRAAGTLLLEEPE